MSVESVVFALIEVVPRKEAKYYWTGHPVIPLVYDGQGHDFFFFFKDDYLLPFLLTRTDDVHWL